MMIDAMLILIPKFLALLRRIVHANYYSNLDLRNVILLSCLIKVFEIRATVNQQVFLRLSEGIMFISHPDTLFHTHVQ